MKSAVETKFWLELLRDTTNLDKNSVNKFLIETENLTNILGASLLTLKRNEKLKAKK